MDDIFYRMLDLTSYLSSSLAHFHEYSTHERCSGRGSSSEECSSLSEYCVATNAKNILLSVCTRRETENRQSHGGTSLVLKGLTLPFCGLRVIQRVALSSCRCFLHYIECAKVQISRTIARVKKTLHGSSDDIRWLQRTPGTAPVKDGTARFLKLLQDVRDGKHMLPDSFVYLLIPGLFSNYCPLYFVATKRFFSKMGLACHIAKIHSEASVEHNAWELKHYIEELYWGSGKRVMLLGHSKGGVDAAAALSKYWSDLRNKVAGLAMVQSPYGGTPIPSDICQNIRKEIMNEHTHSRETPFPPRFY